MPKTKTFVGNFEIPMELAQELSDLLGKQIVREKLLLQLVDDETGKYQKVEDTLVSLTGKIEALKEKITREYVPDHLNRSNYIWNYSGFDIDQNKFQVFEVSQ